MLYELPHHGPPVTLLGPDDETAWATVGTRSAGRHALVIGDRSAPGTTLVVAGSLPDLDRFVDRLYRYVTQALTRLQPQTRQGPTGCEAVAVAPEQPAPSQQVPADAGVELVTLPHCGLRVAHRRLVVAGYRELPTADGVAFTATLRLDHTIVGTAHNEGVGGATGFHPNGAATFGYPQLRVFVAASRTRCGTPCTEEQLLDGLVEEYLTTRRTDTLTGRGRCALRLMAPIRPGDDRDVYTAAQADAPAVTSHTEQAALARQVQQAMPPDDGEWWQIWTGVRWDDLTRRPADPAGAQR